MLEGGFSWAAAAEDFMFNFSRWPTWPCLSVVNHVYLLNIANWLSFYCDLLYSMCSLMSSRLEYCLGAHLLSLAVFFFKIRQFPMSHACKVWDSALKWTTLDRQLSTVSSCFSRIIEWFDKICWVSVERQLLTNSFIWFDWLDSEKKCFEYVLICCYANIQN